MTATIKGTTRIVADHIAYQPYGAVLGWDYGNDLQRDYGYDLDGRLTDIDVRLGGAVRQSGASNSDDLPVA